VFKHVCVVSVLFCEFVYVCVCLNLCMYVRCVCVACV
jgi:hypothetical protein